MITEPKAYEIAFLAKNPEEERAVTDLIKQYQGKILQKSTPQETKLAYPIKKQTSAYFGYVQFELLPEDLEKVSQALKLNAAILRHLVVMPSVLKKVSERKSEILEEARTVPAPASGSAVLTNEALEEKLEEILK